MRRACPAQYGDRIRLHWHWAPDESNAASMRIASISEAVYRTHGNDVFWRFHRLVVDNVEFPFPWPSRTARGLGDEALADYARQAGVNSMYFERDALHAKPRPGRWDAGIAVMKDLGAEGHVYYAGGYKFSSRRRMQQVLDGVIAEAVARR